MSGLAGWRRRGWPPTIWVARPPGQRITLGIVWLAFVVFPVIDAVTTSASGGIKALMIAGSLAFVGAYALLVVTHGRAGDRETQALLVLMLALASVLTVVARPGWGYLFSYCAGCLALVSSSSAGFFGVAGATTLAAVTQLLAKGGGAANALGFGASTAGVGLLMLLLGDLRARNAELVDARAELARLAVARERERFARDLHDLLGHSLSVIAIKAELARRLLPGDATRARDEVGDIESVARAALGEVRDAVSGYRQPTLDGELAGARMALDAAGVSCRVERVGSALEPDAEAVLAWAVREGATNVIRHSGARECTLRVASVDGVASVEVVDDGGAGGGDDMGAPGPGVGVELGGAAGAGLAGLQQRVAEVRGTVAAGPLAGGGYRLAVTVPTPGRAQ